MKRGADLEDWQDDRNRALAIRVTKVERRFSLLLFRLVLFVAHSTWEFRLKLPFDLDIASLHILNIAHLDIAHLTSLGIAIRV